VHPKDRSAGLEAAITVTEQVFFVMKEGRVMKHMPQASMAP
jgi:hypothetical protein